MKLSSFEEDRYIGGFWGGGACKHVHPFLFVCGKKPSLPPKGSESLALASLL